MNRNNVHDENHTGDFIRALVPNFGLLDNPLQYIILRKHESEEPEQDFDGDLQAYRSTGHRASPSNPCVRVQWVRLTGGTPLSATRHVSKFWPLYA